MDGREYQVLAARTDKPNKKQKDLVTNAALGISGEAGEVADHIKKYAFQGHMLSRESVAEELGDILWYVAQMCRGIGWDMNMVMEKNINKLKARYPDGFTEHASINRKE